MNTVFFKALTSASLLFFSQLALSQLDAWHTDAHFTGFGRVVVGTLDTQEADFKEYDNGFNWRPNTLLGGQLKYDFSKSLSATAQGVVRPSRSKDSELEWLFLTWVPDESVVMRLGRQQGPFFLYSDSIDVGFSRAAINLPYQLYSGYIFPNFDGIDITWSFSDETFQYTLEGYAGNYGGGDIYIYGDTTDYELDAVAGLIGKMKFNSIELRLSHYRGKPNLIIPEIDTLRNVLDQAGFTKTSDALNTNGWGYINQFSLMIDKFDYFITAEYMTADSEIKYTAPSIENFYIGGGIYHGAFTFHGTYTISDTSYETFEQEIPLGVNPQLDELYNGVEFVFSRLTEDDLDSLNLGVRWDIKPKLALKADVTFLEGEKGKTSFFSIDNNNLETFDRSAVLYLLAIDWVF